MMFVLAISLPALAQQDPTRDLTPAQKQELQIMIDRMKADNSPSTAVAIRHEAEKWGELGNNMGLALISAAKQLGMAANEFAQTPLGMVTTGIVVYKVVGQELLGVIVGVPLALLGILIGLYVMLSNAFYDVKYDYRPFLFGLWQRKVVTEVVKNGDISTSKVIVGGVIMALGCLVGLNLAF
jgi:hypothetical protein